MGTTRHSDHLRTPRLPATIRPGDWLFGLVAGGIGGYLPHMVAQRAILAMPGMGSVEAYVQVMAVVFGLTFLTGLAPAMWRPTRWSGCGVMVGALPGAAWFLLWVAGLLLAVSI